MQEEEFEDDYEYDENGEIVYYAVRPNKSLIKREIAACFALGEELSKLPAEKLAAFALPEVMEKSIRDVSTMPHTGARKRLLKYIAGYLHKMDIEPIKERLAKLNNQSAHAVREHHLAERWRDRLLKAGNDALTELLDDYPHADSQQLRQLIRNAQKEQQTGKPPKSARLLYKALKDLLQTEPDDSAFAEPDDFEDFEDLEDDWQEDDEETWQEDDD